MKDIDDFSTSSPLPTSLPSIPPAPSTGVFSRSARKKKAIDDPARSNVSPSADEKPNSRRSSLRNRNPVKPPENGDARESGPVDEPLSISPYGSDEEPKLIVAGYPDEYNNRRATVKRQEREFQREMLGLSEEEEWAAARKAEREAEELSWKMRFLQVKQESDEKSARLAELETLAMLAGTSIEDVLLSSSPANNTKAAADADPTAGATGTQGIVNDKDTTSASQVEHHTDKTPISRKSSIRTYTPKGEPSTAAKAILKPSRPSPKTATPTPPSDDEERDPWLELVDEEELAKRTVTELAGLSISKPLPKLITPLSQEWLTNIETALATRPAHKKLVNDRSDVTPQALGTLAGSNWLNDAVINEFIQHIVARQQRGLADDNAAGAAAANTKANAGSKQQQQPPATPSIVALNSNWWNTVNNRTYSLDTGIGKVLRWAKRAKIDGAKLLDVSNLYIPINANSHWTLLAISGRDKTIEYLNSLKGCGPSDEQVFRVARRYLELHLGKDYDADAWTEVSERSAQQKGGVDCGVFVCFNVLSIARGRDPLVSFGPDDMGVARQRISATLLNSGFEGDLEW